MKYLERIGPALLLLFSIGVSAILAYTATQRTLNGLESALWQVFVLTRQVLQVLLFLARQSAKEAAKEIIKPHARKAFRRLVSLYRSLSRAANVIKPTQDNESPENQRVTLAKLDVIVTELLATADDALEDWNDIVPEDVEELKQKFQSNNTTRDEQ